MGEISADQVLCLAADSGTLQGWDFSRMRTDIDPVPWEYNDVVRAFLKPTSRVLDIGTGGGERLLSLAPYFASAVGVDIDSSMIQTAQETMPDDLRDSITFTVAAAENLDFPSQSFNVILNRHAPAVPDLVMRFLRTGGVFVCQEVGGRNTQNVFEWFGWDSNEEYWKEECRRLGLPPPPSIDEVADTYARLGGTIKRNDTYNVPYYFLDPESFVFWLKAILGKHIAIEERADEVAGFIARYTTPRGIETNEHRELLIVQKPEL